MTESLAHCFFQMYEQLKKASSDLKANDSQGNCLRVDRGGSWMFPAWLLRPATRERNPADYRNNIMGFRVARTLP